MFKKYIHNINNKLFLFVGLYVVLCVFLENKLSNFSINNQSVEINNVVYTSTQKLITKVNCNKVTICNHFKRNPIFQNQLPLQDEIIFENLIEDSEDDPDNDFIHHLKKVKSYTIQKLIVNYCTKKSWTLFNAHKSIKSLNLLFCIFRI